MRTTILESANFSDAAVMLEACYTEMLRGGFEQRAAQLRGVEIFSVGDAQSALATLRCMEPTGNEAIDTAARHAMAILESLVPDIRLVAQAS